jgi:phosphoesterase RecJ-like protein
MKPIRRILEALRDRKKILCASHIRADGDGLGSALAFSRMLRKMGKRPHVVCDYGAVPEYRFIPEAESVGSGPRDLCPPYDALATFDCANYERLGRVG